MSDIRHVPGGFCVGDSGILFATRQAATMAIKMDGEVVHRAVQHANGAPVTANMLAHARSANGAPEARVMSQPSPVEEVEVDVDEEEEEEEEELEDDDEEEEDE